MGSEQEIELLLSLRNCCGLELSKLKDDMKEIIDLCIALTSTNTLLINRQRAEGH